LHPLFHGLVTNNDTDTRTIQWGPRVLTLQPGSSLQI
jgi:hypothetical protein